MTFKNGMRPLHPGEVLREEYLKPLDLSANALAKALRLSPSRIGDIVLERRGVTATPCGSRATSAAPRSPG